MEILIGDKGNVDLDAPLKMTGEQKDAFIRFLKTQFAVVEEEKVGQLRADRIGDKRFNRSWTASEYELLLRIEKTAKVAEKLGRAWMSVDIKRGSFLPEFIAFADEKKVDLLKGNTKKLIEEFMKTKEMKKMAKSEEKMKIKQWIREREIEISKVCGDCEFFNCIGKQCRDYNDRMVFENEIEKLKEELDTL